MRTGNGRKRTVAAVTAALLFLAAVLVLGAVLQQQAMQTDLSRKNLPPSPAFPFGTDFLGRDMLSRTLCGLAESIRIGLLASCVSAVVALGLGASAALLGRGVDAAVNWLIDLMMGIPHILLLLLISFACGKGVTGVVLGLTLTHWMSLARVLRAEIMQLRESGYVKIAGKLGKSRGSVFVRHMVPNLLPQFLVGAVLQFPHAILHEASITFLGFGLSAEQPAVGIILSESMKYLVTGSWWLAVFPGVLLVVTVLLFDFIGSSFRRLLDPVTAQE